MLRYLYADELDQYPALKDSMFRDRADQFKTRLKWDVKVDYAGYERDEYDDLNPMYVIWEDAIGRHSGSMRLLPTTGPCMVNDHFSELMNGDKFQSPFIWEATRFFLSANATRRTANALMLAAGEDPESIAAVANLAGGWVCEKVGVVPMVRGELERELTRLSELKRTTE